MPNSNPPTELATKTNFTSAAFDEHLEDAKVLSNQVFHTLNEEGSHPVADYLSLVLTLGIAYQHIKDECDPLYEPHSLLTNLMPMIEEAMKNRANEIH